LTYTVYASTNLAALPWLPIGTVTTYSDGSFQFIDTNGPTLPQRFYKLSWP
jgi:hypothetical protein